MSFTNPQKLNEIAFLILNDEGQIRVSVLMDRGRTHEAKLFLYRKILSLVEDCALTKAEGSSLVDELGFTEQDLCQLSTENSV